jgi:hypothetical protein
VQRATSDLERQMGVAPERVMPGARVHFRAEGGGARAIDDYMNRIVKNAPDLSASYLRGSQSAMNGAVVATEGCHGRPDARPVIASPDAD